MSAFVAIETLVTVAETEMMTRALAIQITGGLSKPSKMPGHAWGTSAWSCITGSKLAQIEGSTCANCYALKNFYRMPNVRAAYERRLERMYHPRWVEAMIFLIIDTGDEFFRWDDSGDLQSAEQLRNIIAVCRAMPAVKFWLPTREYKIVMDFIHAGGVIPENLVIRFSAHMKDAAAPSGYGLPTSTVHTSEEQEPAGKICRAYENKNKCGNCRACWDANVANVSYLEH